MNLIEMENKIYVLDIEDRIIMPNSDSTKKEIKDILEKKEVNKLVINLKKVDFLDSTGVGVILSIFKFLREKDGQLALSNMSKAIQRIFKITQIDVIIPTYDSVEAAIAGLKTKES